MAILDISPWRKATGGLYRYMYLVADRGWIDEPNATFAQRSLTCLGCYGAGCPQDGVYRDPHRGYSNGVVKVLHQGKSVIINELLSVSEEDL